MDKDNVIKFAEEMASFMNKAQLVEQLANMKARTLDVSDILEKEDFASDVGDELKQIANLVDTIAVKLDMKTHVDKLRGVQEIHHEGMLKQDDALMQFLDGAEEFARQFGPSLK